jgi:hypothetical protein
LTQHSVKSSLPSKRLASDLCRGWHSAKILQLNPVVIDFAIKLSSDDLMLACVSYSRSTRCRSVGVSIPFRIKQHKVHRCRERGREWNGEVLPITSLRGGVCHGISVGGEKPVQWRRRWGIPPLAVRTLGIGLGLGVVAARVNLVSWAVGPTPLYRHCAVGPTNLCWVWCPRSGRWPKGPCWSLGQPGGDQPNILPLDLNIYLNFRLNFTLLSFSIPS